MKLSIIKNNKFLKKFLILLFWILMWEVLYYIIGRDFYFPSLRSVIKELFFLIQDITFWKIISISIYRVILGLFFAIILGVSLGFICGINAFLYEFFKPLISLIKSTPVISFIVIALIWFSSNNVPIFISFLMCFPIIWTNIVSGVQNVDENLIEMANIYNLKKITIIKKIFIPSIMPYFNASLITAIGLGWKVSVAAEVLAHPRYGIGSNIHTAKAYLDTPLLFAWTLVVIILSFLFESIFQYISSKGVIK